MAKKIKEEAQKTRLNIIDSARLIFSTHGVQQTTLEHIAKMAGVTRGAIYWHFKDKKEILYAISLLAEEAMQKRITLAESRGKKADNSLVFLEEYLLATALGIWGDVKTYQIFVILNMMCEHTEELSPILKRMDLCYYRHLQLFSEAFEGARSRGLINNKASDSLILAKNTHMFLSGLCKMILAKICIYEDEIRELVHSHMAILIK